MAVESFGDSADPLKRSQVSGGWNRAHVRLSRSQQAIRLVTERQKVAVRVGVEWHGRVIPGA